MHKGFVASFGVAVSVAGLADVLGQASRPAPAFEVVSIRRSAPEQRPGFPPETYRVQERPDGGVTIANAAVANLIARAYPPTLPLEIVGLPEWARSDRYNVSATSSLPSATRDDHLAMMRSMLADRFKLTVHFEKREQPAFDLVLARRDGKLGSGLTPVGVACPAKAAVPDASTEKPATPPPMPDFTAPPPPCTFRIVGPVIRDRFGDGQGKLGDLLEGEGTIASLTEILRGPAARPIVDKTGLAGGYRVAMNFDMFARLKGPTVTPSQDAAPSVFAAVEQQLGLKLEASRQLRDTLVVDTLERPTEN
ncbi:MAG: TIGR03435 family protein [Vicinamibacterales bacterium]